MLEKQRHAYLSFQTVPVKRLQPWQTRFPSFHHLFLYLILFPCRAFLLLVRIEIEEIDVLNLAIVQFFVRVLFPTCTHGQIVVPWWSRRVQHEYSTCLRIRWCRINFLRWIFSSPMSSSTPSLLSSLSQERTISNEAKLGLEWKYRMYEGCFESEEGETFVRRLAHAIDGQEDQWLVERCIPCEPKMCRKQFLNHMWRFEYDNFEKWMWQNSSNTKKPRHLV